MALDAGPYSRYQRAKNVLPKIKRQEGKREVNKRREKPESNRGSIPKRKIYFFFFRSGSRRVQAIVDWEGTVERSAGKLNAQRNVNFALYGTNAFGDTRAWLNWATNGRECERSRASHSSFYEKNVSTPPLYVSLNPFVQGVPETAVAPAQFDSP